MQRSILLDTDSYKVSHYLQYPPGTETIYSYISSRGGKYDEVMLLGVQAFVMEKLSIPITKAEIDLAEKFWTAHGEPFNRDGWDYILTKYNGFLPVQIDTLPEGHLYPVNTPMVVMWNTDPNCYWLPSWLETSLLRYVWYMSTVGTNSFMMKQKILSYLEKSGDPSSIYFKLHDFGLRGVSSLESGMLGGLAHLVNFYGSDTAIAAFAANEYYDADLLSTTFSIPAAEHSSITSWGRGNEALAYENMVNQFSKPGSVYAVVSDSYDIYNAVENIWGKELKGLVISSGGTLVIRPDSGDPIEVLPKLFSLAYKKFGGVKNTKGYVVLNNVRFIWGDGIDSSSVDMILRMIVDVMGYSADNIAFGMGGGLLQQVNRDTQKFAMKCSAALINGQWVDVFKDPVTDPGKSSLKGRFNDLRMFTIYDTGHFTKLQNFTQIRKNSELYL